MDILNQTEGEEGLYITKKAKVTHIVSEYSCYYAIKDCETNKTKVKVMEGEK